MACPDQLADGQIGITDCHLPFEAFIFHLDDRFESGGDSGIPWEGFQANTDIIR